MINFRHSGATLTYKLNKSVEEPIKSGSGIVLKDIFGVSTNSVQKEGDTTEVALDGVFTLPKVSDGNIETGQRLFWNIGLKKVCSAPASDDTKTILIGVAAEDKLSTSEFIDVRLNGVNVR